MAADMDDSGSQDRNHQELRLAVLLLALVVGLLITGAAIYLAREHPSLAQPLGVGATVMSALAAIAGVISRVMRR
ncbi:hypothetical protein [Streptomyces griseosporeus]|uniref:hypothetical protein n=1 Tax=Streptomyces griseosporeus TaxID=1910 RepID=UPI0007185F78|nr:hypothetical protein SHL15_6682 [Streptomyces hygroscopicus subsp. limoneus]